jgi:Ca2+-binding RTX toxin-like protein
VFLSIVLNSDDVVAASEFDDEVQTFGGDDVVFASFGDDLVKGGEGKDTLYGDSGRDFLFGEEGDDVLDGSLDNDALVGGTGADRLIGGFGTDTAIYSEAVSRIHVALDGSVKTKGESVGDTFESVENVAGSRYADLIVGNEESNALAGLAGQDTIRGQAGRDLIYGGLGRDRIGGGAGADTFYYNSSAEGGDVIVDFALRDKFLLFSDNFKTLPQGLLQARHFLRSTTNQARDDDDYFIFRTTDDTLWFDTNANGSGGLTKIADLDTDIRLTAKNIEIIVTAPPDVYLG